MQEKIITVTYRNILFILAHEFIMILDFKSLNNISRGDSKMAARGRKQKASLL
jgi:hypothetical protein